MEINSIYSGTLTKELIDPLWLFPGHQQLFYAGRTDEILECLRNGRN
jgi:hypothetical protein